MHVILLAILLVLSGCDKHGVAPSAGGSNTSTRSTIPATTNAPEIEVLVALLKSEYGRGISNGYSLVLDERFSIEKLYFGESYGRFAESLLQDTNDPSLLHDSNHKVPKAPVDLIRDFCSRNEKNDAIWPELRHHLPVVFLSRKEKAAMFANRRDTKPDGWELFHSKYPKSLGIITVSQVGFNAKGDLAMVYLGQQAGWLSGRGRIHIFQNQGGSWKETQIRIGPEWKS